MKKWNNPRGFERRPPQDNDGEKTFTGTKIEVRNNDVNFALRKLKKILERNDFQKELSRHEYFEKPSVKRKRNKEAAKKRWQKEVNKMRLSGVWQDSKSGDQKYMKSKRKRRKILDQQTMLQNIARAKTKSR